MFGGKHLQFAAIVSGDTLFDFSIPSVHHIDQPSVLVLRMGFPFLFRLRLFEMIELLKWYAKYWRQNTLSAIVVRLKRSYRANDRLKLR